MLDDPIHEQAIQNQAIGFNYERNLRFYAYSKKLADRVVEFQHNASRGTHENAVAAVYMRGYYYLSTLAKLDRPADVQVVESIARTLFELLLDLKILIIEPNSHIKYGSYNKLAWMKAALDLYDFMVNNPSARHETRYFNELEIATDPKKLDECRDILVKMYGKHPNEVETEEKFKKRVPANWTGISKGLYGRAEKVDQHEKNDNDFGEYYRGYLYKNNWLVHGGSAGIAGRTPAMFANEWARAHNASLRLLINLTVLTFQELKLDSLVPSLRADIEAIANHEAHGSKTV